MHQYILKKGDFKSFFNKVMEDSDFIAPVESSDSKQVSKSFFKRIDNVSEVFLDKKTYYPVKSLFFDPAETIFEFDGNKVIDPKISLKQKVIFGLRKCDLNGIMHQDMVFLDENPDPFYKARRDASILIGYHCKKGDDTCFCNSFELKKFHDLMFFDKGDFYCIEVGSIKGQEFINQFLDIFEVTEDLITDEDRITKNKLKLNNLDIKDKYNSPDWEKGSSKCLACGACNFLCPNCHCFTIEDSVNFDLKTGKRVRKPASCQLRNFTRVAGDHVFRNEKNARFKHRIYHQIQYFKDRHDVVFCTGCGRCIEGCPAKINWVGIITDLK